MNTRIEKAMQEYELALKSLPMYAPDPKVTAEDLKKRNIACADDLTEALLPYISTNPQSFDLINSIFEGLNQRDLTISIGKGIHYHLWYHGKHGSVEVNLKTQDDWLLAYPMTVQVTASHEPQTPSEHHESCPYAHEHWPTDEDGRSFWEYGCGDRNYDPECWCEYVIDHDETFAFDSDQDFSEVINYFDERMAEL